MAGWPEQIAERARMAAREAQSRGAIEAANLPDAVYSATLAAALELEEKLSAAGDSGVTRDSSPDLSGPISDGTVGRPDGDPPVLDLGGRPSTSPYDPENA